MASGHDLREDPCTLEAFAAEVGIVGRISPEAKRDVVAALARRGHHAAMIRDGVDDVPALKAARLAIAQGTGTQLAKSLADLVLVDGDFAAVPAHRAGPPDAAQPPARSQALPREDRPRRPPGSHDRCDVDRLPLLPRHFSLAATPTIGIPTFFLALARSNGPWRPDHFAAQVAQFGVSAWALVGVGVVASYLFALHDLDYSVPQSRTIATSVLVIAGLHSR